MAELIQIIIGGLQIGCIYALVALGFSLVYRVTNVINLGQGAFCLVGPLAELKPLVRARLKNSRLRQCRQVDAT